MSDKDKVSDSIPSVNATSNNGNGSRIFDPERLRISETFADRVGVKRILTQVPVQKPHRQAFVRVHPDPAYSIDTIILETKEDREIFLVDPSLGAELPGEITAISLYTAITRQEVLFLWPVRLPDPSGKRNRWAETARQGALLAREKWVRIASNLQAGYYEIFEATGDLPEPEWPDKTLEELLTIAFGGSYIADLSHPVIRRLRGQI